MRKKQPFVEKKCESHDAAIAATHNAVPSTSASAKMPFCAAGDAHARSAKKERHET